MWRVHASPYLIRTPTRRPATKSLQAMTHPLHRKLDYPAAAALMDSVRSADKKIEMVVERDRAAQGARRHKSQCPHPVLPRRGIPYPAERRHRHRIRGGADGRAGQGPPLWAFEWSPDGTRILTALGCFVVSVPVDGAAPPLLVSSPAVEPFAAEERRVVVDRQGSQDAPVKFSWVGGRNSRQHHVRDDHQGHASGRG